jgi:hypothetical protein
MMGGGQVDRNPSNSPSRMIASQVLKASALLLVLVYVRSFAPKTTMCNRNLVLCHVEKRSHDNVVQHLVLSALVSFSLVMAPGPAFADGTCLRDPFLFRQI